MPFKNKITNLSRYGLLVNEYKYINKYIRLSRTFKIVTLCNQKYLSLAISGSAIRIRELLRGESIALFDNNNQLLPIKILEVHDLRADEFDCSNDVAFLLHIVERQNGDKDAVRVLRERHEHVVASRIIRVLVRRAGRSKNVELAAAKRPQGMDGTGAVDQERAG